MGHQIEWGSAEYRRGEVTVRVEPRAPFEWELLFNRLAYSMTWPFGEIEIANSVVRVAHVRERVVEWLPAHLNAAVAAADKAFGIVPAVSERSGPPRFSREEAADTESNDRLLTDRLRQFAFRP